MSEGKKYATLLPALPYTPHIPHYFIGVMNDDIRTEEIFNLVVRGLVIFSV